MRNVFAGIFVAAGLAAVLFTMASSYAQDGGVNPEKTEACSQACQGCAGCYADLLARAEELGLTEEQRSRLTHWSENSAKKREQMVADLDAARKRLATLIEAKDTDLQAVHAEVDKAAKAWGDLHYACIRNLIEVRDILGQEKWDAWRASTSCRPLTGFGRMCGHDGSQASGCGIHGKERASQGRSGCHGTKPKTQPQSGCRGRGGCHTQTTPEGDGK